MRFVVTRWSWSSKIYIHSKEDPQFLLGKLQGLLLKEMFKESDESVVERWIENAYWQYSCDKLGNRTHKTEISNLSIKEVNPLSSLKVYPDSFNNFLNID